MSGIEAPAPPRRRGRRSARADGAIAILFFGALFIVFGFFALALDMSQLYNRKMELQTAADTAALAAAFELNGTKEGIVRALDQAATPFALPPPAKPLKYQYGYGAMVWSDAAIAFGKNSTGPWQSSEVAKSQPEDLLFAKVDTAALKPAYGQVRTMFVATLGESNITEVRATAVAGRSAIKVTPLGICAMRSEAYRSHNGELEEYGFRRGMGYNLVDLNPMASAAGATFIVNPYPGSPITDPATLAPFVCTGTIPMARITGKTVTVSTGFPIDPFFNQLNSRFGTYPVVNNPCDPRTAPSDTNLREYPFNGTPAVMAATPDQQSARLYQEKDFRATIAWPDATPSGTKNVHYGTLWTFAKAVDFTQYQAGVPEPVGGYKTFDTTKWETLYPAVPKVAPASNYPSDTPYTATGGVYYKQQGANKGQANRRVLNLPLLACPVSDGHAHVQAVGKFLMTVQATGGALYGEFGGLVPDQAIGTQVVLYP